jgi:hypothetical protein
MAPIPRFATGDRVTVQPDTATMTIRPGVYTITRALPANSQGYQYRVRNDLDSHDRVFSEVQLRALPARA